MQHFGVKSLDDAADAARASEQFVKRYSFAFHPVSISSSDKSASDGAERAARMTYTKAQIKSPVIIDIIELTPLLFERCGVHLSVYIPIVAQNPRNKSGKRFIGTDAPAPFLRGHARTGPRIYMG
ncbi:hypothetical protein GCM10027018_05680 [Paenibacillus thermoaerophilus]